ncbi:hypothetical protein EDD16DRAFT_1723157 [Pisolithus croceorrhizus]|nr:hypothetical protein EDD16DRAFT_1723157 [Pisolithus croceorrhizus]
MRSNHAGLASGPMWTTGRNKTDSGWTGVMHAKYLRRCSNPRHYVKYPFLSGWNPVKETSSLGFAKASNSTSGLPSSLGRSKIRAGNFPSIPKTPGMASPGGLARMRRFFRRSGQDSSVAIVTEVTDTQAGGVSQVAPDQDACDLPHPVDAMVLSGSTNRLLQHAPVAGRKNNKNNSRQLRPKTDSVGQVAKSVAKSEPEPKSKLEPEPKPESKLEESKPKPEAELTLALAGQHVDAAVKVFGGDDPISGVAKGAADAVGIVDTAFSGIQTLREIFFNQVVSILANVHPYAQAALGILTSFSLLFMNQANLDGAVSDLLHTVGSVYEWLMQEDRISNLDKVALAKIARAISDSAHFIINYSTTKSSC